MIEKGELIMRKIIIAILLSMVLVSNVACAESIDFLDLKWGASFNEFLTALMSNGLDGKTPCHYKKEDSFSLSSYTTHDEIAYGDTYTELYTTTVELYDQGKMVWEIGGQPVYKIIGTFVPGTIVKDDGLAYYSGDIKLARLVRVELELGTREAQSFGSTRVGFDTIYDTFNDMKNKLCAVYGDDYKYSDSSVRKTEFTSITWNQGNGWVELKKVDSTLSSSGVVVQGVDTKLIYGFNDVSFISGIWKDFHKDDLDGL